RAFHLRRQAACREGLVGRWQGVAELTERKRRRGEDRADPAAVPPQRRKRRGLERARRYASHSERGQTLAHLRRGLVGESHGQKLLRREDVARNLVGDPPRDR